MSGQTTSPSLYERQGSTLDEVRALIIMKTVEQSPDMPASSMPLYNAIENNLVGIYGPITFTFAQDKTSYKVFASPIMGLGRETNVRVTLYETTDLEAERTKTQALEEENQKLKIKGEEQQVKIAALQVKIEALNNFNLGFVHDLKNKFTASYGNAQLMQRWISKESTERDGKTISILGVIVDLLRSAKKMAEAYPDKLKTFDELKKEPVDIIPFLRDLSSVIAILDEDIAITFDSDLQSQVIMADQTALESIFVNLIKNAKDAGGTQIAMTCEINGNSTYIHVKDNGSGIPTDLRSVLFNKKEGSCKEGGNGIGLFDVKNKMEGHQGRINVATTVTQEELDQNPKLGQTGTDFEIMFPIKEREYKSS